MDGVLGKTFRRGKETVDLEALLEVKDFVAVYFGAHWAPPCRLFTQTLTEFSKALNQSSGIPPVNIVFCSIDGNEAAFERNFDKMPDNWFAIPYTDEQRIQNLKQKFGINGIPTLVVLDKKGEMVSFDGRLDIQNH